MNRRIPPRVNINQMNDDCMVAIFRLFSHRNLIRLRVVCRRWQVIIEIVGSEKKTLKLFGSFRDVDDYCRALLQYNLEEDSNFKLSVLPIHDEIVGTGYNRRYSSNPNKRVKVSHDASFNFLAHLFPNISQLIVCDRYRDDNTFCISTSWHSIVEFDLTYLLAEWSGLTSLTLFMFPTEKLFSIVNSANLSSLKCLQLLKTARYYSAASDNHGCNGNLNKLSQTLLAQLDDFSLGLLTYNLDSIFPNFGVNLKRLKLYDCSAKHLFKLAELKPEIVSNLTHFTINISEIAHLQLVCNKFTSLQFLCFMISRRITFDQVIEGVSNLESLSKLQICFYSDYSKYQYAPTTFMDVDPKFCNKYQLKSIKQLQLKNCQFGLNSSIQLHDFVPKIFPNLERLSIADRCRVDQKKEMLKKVAAYQNYVNQFGNGHKCNFYFLSLQDDIKEFIGNYGDIYKQFKNDRKFSRRR